MALTAKQVKELREKTGAGMMDCKKALVECDGDIQKAIVFLREKGLASAGKKSDRVAAEGAVGSYVSEDGKVGAIVEINCETDFVAKNDDFQSFVKEIAEFIAENNPKDVEELLASEKDGKSVQDLLKEKIAVIGENIVIRRFAREEANDGMIGTYIHMGGKIGAIVSIDGDSAKEEFKEFVKDISMQIAAAAPRYLTRDDVSKEEIEKESEVYANQAKNEGKPDKVIERIVEGKISKMYKEICLVEQVFVKNGDYTVTSLAKEIGTKTGTDVKINDFTRYQMGEGLEKREENFAEEIKKQLQ